MSSESSSLEETGDKDTLGHRTGHEGDTVRLALALTGFRTEAFLEFAFET